MKKKDNLTTIKEVVMRNLGVASLDEVNAWAIKFWARKYRIDKLSEAVNFAKEFKLKKVLICGDYDVDGVTSTSILTHSLRSAGFRDVSFRIPRRFSEGFGLNRIMIDEAIANGVNLIITCDNGVAQVDPVNYAVENGIKVIIIDHHEPSVIDGKRVYPNADFIIDPNAIDDSADFKGYCGAGLSFKFACELLGKGPKEMSLYLGWAALGTVADVMELREENWCIVRYGLKALLKETTAGTKTLLQENGLTSKITATDVGFKIGPSINAASRMNDNGAEDAVKTLLCYDPDKAYPLARILVEANEERKALKKEMMIEARNQIKENELDKDAPIVLKYDKCEHEGILGIIAGNVCEKYKRPAIILGDIGEDILRGSARSCGNFDIKAALDAIQTLLAKYGGHAGAAGLSVYKEKYVEFVKAIHKLGESFVPDPITESVYDLVITAAEAKATLMELARYEPYGNGNAPVVFKITGFTPVPKYGKLISYMGDGSIAKMSNGEFTAMFFDVEPDTFKNVANRYTLVGTLSVNTFGGREEPQIQVIDFEPEPDNKVITGFAALLQS